MAKRPVTPGRRGRTTVALGLMGFLIVTVAVVARRSWGRSLQRDLDGIERTRTQLTGEAVKLRAEISTASSRNRIIPLVESSLGMRVPAETQVIDLPVSEGARVTP
jgi:cell division protein FtsL